MTGRTQRQRGGLHQRCRTCSRCLDCTAVSTRAQTYSPDESCKRLRRCAAGTTVWWEPGAVLPPTTAAESCGEIAHRCGYARSSTGAPLWRQSRRVTHRAAWRGRRGGGGVGACLEEDIGGVEVAVADALAVDVRHALCDASQHSHHRLPPVRQRLRGEHAVRDRRAQAAAIAVLLHPSSHSYRATCALCHGARRRRAPGAHQAAAPRNCMAIRRQRSDRPGTQRSPTGVSQTAAYLAGRCLHACGQGGVACSGTGWWRGCAGGPKG